MTSLLFILAGFVILMFGGETLVNGAVSVAKRLDVPPLVIGVVLVGFGTSVPELVTSIEAVLRGSEGIAVGNVLGSNIANVLLVAGAGALLIPVAKPTRGFTRDSLVLAVATLMLIATAYAGSIDRIVGTMYLAVLGLYIAYMIMTERKSAKKRKAEKIDKGESFTIEKSVKSIPMGLLLSVIGIAMTVLGAKLLVEGAVDIARLFGVSETVIGVTIVAIGTSLPELATAVIAGVKGESDVSIGNIIGSNIYNILAILGATALVKPFSIDPSILKFDLWVMVFATILIIHVPVAFKGINRTMGGLFLAGYFTYLAAVYFMFV